MKVQHDREYIYHKISSSSTPVVEKVEYFYKDNEIKYDSLNNNIPLYIETFTARTLSTRTEADKVFFRGFDANHSLSGSGFWSDNIFYQIQSKFFPEDAFQKRNYITNPGNGESVSSLHCISFSNHLFIDKFDSLNSDIIISITGDLESSSFLGYGSYGGTSFVYTDYLSTISDVSTLSKTNDGLKIPTWDEYGFDYVYVMAKVYYDGTMNYKLSGALLKDFGLIILFNNPDGWPDFDTAKLINKDDVNFGSTEYPAVGGNILGQDVKYNYVRYYYDYKLAINLPGDKANYTSNYTARDLSGSYKFNHINDLVKLSQTQKAYHPKTYITTISLMNDRNEVMAICKLPNPIKKDFLNEYDFNIRIRK